MSSTKVVVMWLDELKVSTEELNVINEEDRYVGATTNVKVGTKYFTAVVKCISSKYMKSSVQNL